MTSWPFDFDGGCAVFVRFCSALHGGIYDMAAYVTRACSKINLNFCATQEAHKNQLAQTEGHLSPSEFSSFFASLSTRQEVYFLLAQ